MDICKDINSALKSLLEGKNIDKFDTESIADEDIKAICISLNTLSDTFLELKNYSTALSHGDLDIDFPSRRNFLASGLKQLHSNLLHLSWKVEQISKGDYLQRVDFMGVFSISFNNMVDRLNKREIQLEESQKVLENVLKHSNTMVFVISAKTRDLLYIREEAVANTEDYQAFEVINDITVQLQDMTMKAFEKSYNWELKCDVNKNWYAVKSMLGTWVNKQEAYIHMLFDVSENKELEEKLELALSRDAKTGIYNEAFGLQVISKNLKNNSTFSVCFIDLDNLKFTNDTLGHNAGDIFIQKFISTVKAEIRALDILCRIGGDEFLLILPNANELAAERILERILNTLYSASDMGNNEILMDFSYGIIPVTSKKIDNVITSLIDGQICNEYDVPREIIKKADVKMYEQKRKKKENI